MKNLHASTSESIPPGGPGKNAEPEKSIFEVEEVRVLTVVVPGKTEWLRPHDHRDRLVVMLDKTGQLLARDCDPASPARWAWIPANSTCQVVNKADQTRNLMIVEFNDANDREIFKTESIEAKGNLNHEN